MLHKRKLPKAHARDLLRVFSAQQRLLRWIIIESSAVPTQAALEEKFESKLGQWFWRRMFWGQKTDFGNSVDRLSLLALKDPVGACQAWSAVRADMDFARSWPNPSFGFAFPQLPAEWREAIGAVANRFYDWLVDRGYSQAVFGLCSGDLTRQAIMRAYDKGYSRVCGYCDGNLGDLTDRKSANDIDHFFPKANYPHLSIHPYNLYPACKECNEYWKGESSPVPVVKPGMLCDTYHPRFMPAASLLELKVIPDPDNWRRLSVHFSDPVVPVRATHLERVLQLAKRWEYRVNKDLERDRSAWVSDVIHCRQNTGSDLTEEDVRDSIEMKYRRMRSKIDREADSLIRLCVLKHQSESQEEIDEILEVVALAS